MKPKTDPTAIKSIDDIIDWLITERQQIDDLSAGRKTDGIVSGLFLTKRITKEQRDRYYSNRRKAP